MTDNCTVTPDVLHADLTAENEDCPSFDLDKYVAPFWEGNTVYNECVFPITGADGTLSPFELMYPAERIVRFEITRLPKPIPRERIMRLWTGSSSFFRKRR